jgi:hypothetical protein
MCTGRERGPANVQATSVPDTTAIDRRVKDDVNMILQRCDGLWLARVVLTTVWLIRRPGVAAA